MLSTSPYPFHHLLRADLALQIRDLRQPQLQRLGMLLLAHAHRPHSTRS